MGFFGDAWEWTKGLPGAAGEMISGGDGHRPLHYGYDEDQYGQHRQGQAGVRDDQQWLTGQYRNMITGQGQSVAQNQLRESTAENQRMGMAMARSGTGPMAGGAQYAAMRNNAATQQMANRQAATLRAQETAGAMQGMGAHTGNVRGQDIGMLQAEQGYQTDKAGVHAQVEGAKGTQSESEAGRRGKGGLFSLGMMGGLMAGSDERTKRGPGAMDEDEWASGTKDGQWASKAQSPIVRDFPGDGPALEGRDAMAVRNLGDDLSGRSGADPFMGRQTFGGLETRRNMGVMDDPYSRNPELAANPFDPANKPEVDWSAFREGGVLEAMKGVTPSANQSKDPWRWARMKEKDGKDARASKGPPEWAKGDDSFAQGWNSGGGISSLFGDDGLFSDERSKVPVETKGGEMDEFLSDLEGYKYRYKPGVGEDPRLPYVGVMAQDVEKSPVGKTIVGERGGMKVLDTQHGFGTTLAAMGRLNERIAKLEGRKGRA